MTAHNCMLEITEEKRNKEIMDCQVTMIVVYII